jgi:molybdopterin-guanine dinucleotide biosynthesis protein A
VGSIVLAGGKSRRMGRDKALLPFQGTTLLNHVVGIVRQVSEPVLVVAEAADKYDVPSGVRVILDRYPGAGPLGGLITGLRELGEGRHLAVACDMPTLRPDVLHFILTRCDGYDAAVPVVDGRMQPLCTAYDFSCADKLEELFCEGARSLLETLASLHCRVIEESELRPLDPTLSTFSNWNTPDDLPYGQS